MRIFVIMSNNVDERNIIFQLQNGDRRAISDFIDTYGKFMYNVTYRILGQVPDAEEATQDAVLKVLKIYFLLINILLSKHGVILLRTVLRLTIRER